MINIVKRMRNKYDVLQERKRLLRYYKNNPDLVDDEVGEILEYLRHRKLRVYNYKWADIYAKRQVEILYDYESDLYYSMYYGYRIYLKKSLDTNEKRQNCCRARLRDQDVNSPHSYDNFMDHSTFDVLLDIGSAEGNFAIKYMDRVNRIVIIESDPEWIDALKKTMEPFGEKVTIIPKYLSNINSEEHITLDELMKQGVLKKGESFVIKMDIEGAEEKALEGGREYLGQDIHSKVIACAYHHQEAEENIYRILGGYGYTINHAKGYMYFPKYYEKKLFPEKKSFISILRRGLVVGDK